MTKKRIAIITGASAGLGVEFARQLPQYGRFDEVWLIARRLDQLEKLASEMQSMNPKCLALDLSSRENINRVREKLAAEECFVDVLINNAGFGKIGAFQEIDCDSQVGMIDVNVSALTELTHLCLPYMRENSAIVQVASSIGFVPAPYFTVYAATKAYVVSFGRALRYELRKRKIRVLTVCPGPVRTEFFEVAKPTEKSEPFNESLMITAEKCVRDAYRDLQSDREISFSHWFISFFCRIIGLVPKALVFPALSKRL